MNDPLDVAAIRALIVDQIAIADGMKYSDARAVANRTAAALTALLARVEALEVALDHVASGELGVNLCIKVARKALGGTHA